MFVIYLDKFQLYMKKVLISCLVLFAQTTMAQVYPYAENFNAMSPYTNPSGGWITSVSGFQIYPTHGNSSQGLTKQLTSFQLTDSARTPLIGPLTALSVLSIDYRLVESSLYPAIGATPGANDKVELSISGTGLAETTILTINSSNHVVSSAFATKTVSLGAFAGKTVKLMIKVTRGASVTDYYDDFDNLSLSDATGLVELNGESSLLQPNPLRAGDDVLMAVPKEGTYTVKIMDLNGKVLENRAEVSLNKVLHLTTSAGLAAGQYIVSYSGPANGTCRMIVE